MAGENFETREFLFRKFKGDKTAIVSQKIIAAAAAKLPRLVFVKSCKTAIFKYVRRVFCGMKGVGAFV